MSGRWSLITGASGNLGTCFADTLAGLKSNLILVDVNGRNLEKQSKELSKKWGVDVSHIEVDLSKEEGREVVALSTKAITSKLDVLINNAAFLGHSNLPGWKVEFENQTLETWRKCLELNLTSIFDLSQKLLELMKESDSASIINISSVYSIVGPDWSLYADTDMGNPAAYSASKGGLNQLTIWMASTLAPRVRVNGLILGGVQKNQPENFVHRYSTKTPMKRMATREDFRGGIAFLASGLSSYVTGHLLVIDGGFTVV